MKKDFHFKARGPKPRTLRDRQFGYSVFDLLTTSVVASVLGLGAVGMHGLAQDSRMTSTVNQLMGHLHLMRSEAIKRQIHVTMCKSHNGIACVSENPWEKGWIIFVDENANHVLDANEAIIHVQSALDRDLSLRYGETDSYGYVRYNPVGEVYPGATFSVCDNRGSDKAKAVIVYWTGRPRVSNKTSDNKPLNCS